MLPTSSTVYRHVKKHFPVPIRPILLEKAVCTPEAVCAARVSLQCRRRCLSPALCTVMQRLSSVWVVGGGSCCVGRGVGVIVGVIDIASTPCVTLTSL